MTIFTPIFNGKRITITVSDEEARPIREYGRRLGFKGEVTDIKSGKRFRIYGKACSLPNCVCDATALQLCDLSIAKRAKQKV